MKNSLKNIFIVLIITSLVIVGCTSDPNTMGIIDGVDEQPNLLKVYMKLWELNFNRNNCEKAYEYLKLSQNTLEICY